VVDSREWDSAEEDHGGVEGKEGGICRAVATKRQTDIGLGSGSLGWISRAWYVVSGGSRTATMKSLRKALA
jgi:hypothetical protein